MLLFVYLRDKLQVILTMAEEIDDESGFYREDFSTESDWEVFIACLGELFQKWDVSASRQELQPNELFDCKWSVLTETSLELLRKKISVSFYAAQLKDTEGCSEGDLTSKFPAPFHCDLMSLRNTFGPPVIDGRRNSKLHPLARLYGLQRFVVIQPLHMQTQYFSTPAEFSFLVSAATVVAAEVFATVPIFVQIYDPKWNFFVGVGVSSMLRTNFDLVALDKSPAEYRYLAGLLAMFKQKLPGTCLRPATVSVRNTYSLDTVRVRISMRVPFAKAPTAEEEQENGATMLSMSQFIALPSGYFPNSHTEMYAIYTWPEIAENIAFDSELRSDFVPSKAPKGSIHHVPHATSYLSSCLRDYCKLYGIRDTLESFVGRNFSGTASAADASNPLDKLTSSRLRLRTHRSHAALNDSPRKKLPGPMNDNELAQMLLYLFPDTQADVVMFPYAVHKVHKRNEFDPYRIKSTTPDSIVSRLSCLLATCNAHFGGKSGMAQLWAAFTRELRFRWDFCVNISGVAAGFPDTRTCLLHQKLQMLNVCMQRCARREFEAKPAAARETASGCVVSDDDEGPDDEFFDCANYEEPPAEGQAHRPEGRLKRLGVMKLLHSEEPLYVPVTQEPVPKTEDQLHSDAEVMLKLGPGSGLTTQMMCSSLLSDMEAFKAANPKAAMEDFIRWYSPKDWEEEQTEQTQRNEEDESGEVVTAKGKLSARMLAPDNTWQTVWKQAQPVAAWRQKRLFDDTNEALKVLHYLETRTIGEIYELTVVPMLHAALLKLKDIFSNAAVLDLFQSQLDATLGELCSLSRAIDIDQSGQSSSPVTLIERIETLERLFYHYKCFERVSGHPHCSLLDELKQQFAEMLANDGSCSLNMRRDKGDDGGGLLNPRFKDELRDQLISKDYVIRVDGERTASAGKEETTGAQFLRAIVTGEKIRICGAFTESTTFV